MYSVLCVFCYLAIANYFTFPPKNWTCSKKVTRNKFFSVQPHPLSPNCGKQGKEKESFSHSFYLGATKAFWQKNISCLFLKAKTTYSTKVTRKNLSLFPTSSFSLFSKWIEIRKEEEEEEERKRKELLSFPSPFFLAPTTPLTHKQEQTKFDDLRRGITEDFQRLTKFFG